MQSHLPYILALITFVGWGTGDLFTIITSRKIGANLTTFWIFFFSFVLSLFVLPFAPHALSHITFTLLLLNIFLGILSIIGNVLVSEAFRISSAPLVGIIIQAFPAVVLLLSAIIFKDIITPLQGVFITIIFVGVFLCSVDIKKLLKAEKIIDKGTILALIAMVFFSLYFTFTRIPILQYGWFLPNFIATACFPVIYFFIKAKKEKFAVPKPGIILLSAFMAGFLIRSGDFALNWGLSIPGASSTVAPLAGAAPVLFVIASSFIFKDKITKQQVGGIITALVGIVLLTVVG